MAESRPTSQYNKSIFRQIKKGMKISVSMDEKKVAAKKGFLEKNKGQGFFSKWDKRWMMVLDNVFFYFKSQTDEVPKGAIDLEHSQSFLYEAGGRPGMQIMAGQAWSNGKFRSNQTYNFIGSDQADMEEWFKAVLHGGAKNLTDMYQRQVATLQQEQKKAEAKKGGKKKADDSSDSEPEDDEAPLDAPVVEKKPEPVVGDTIEDRAKKTGWMIIQDEKSGKPYYHHRTSGVVTWKMPEELKPVQRVNDAPGLPDGWAQLLDKSTGRPYYYHKATKRVVWNLPKEEKVPPSTPPKPAGPPVPPKVQAMPPVAVPLVDPKLAGAPPPLVAPSSIDSLPPPAIDTPAPVAAPAPGPAPVPAPGPAPVPVPAAVGAPPPLPPGRRQLSNGASGVSQALPLGISVPPPTVGGAIPPPLSVVAGAPPPLAGGIPPPLGTGTPPALPPVNGTALGSPPPLDSLPPPTPPKSKHPFVKQIKFRSTLSMSSELGIPEVVVDLISHLHKTALDHQGIFRIPGGGDEVAEIRSCYDSEAPPDLNKFDANAVSGALKLFFLGLPSPLIPYHLQEEFTECYDVADVEKKRDALQKVIEKLPGLHKLTLVVLTWFLREIEKNSDVNSMNTRNLAIVFTPTLFRAEDSETYDPVDMFHKNNIMETLINDFEDLFEKDRHYVKEILQIA